MFWLLLFVGVARYVSLCVVCVLLLSDVVCNVMDVVVCWWVLCIVVVLCLLFVFVVVVRCFFLLLICVC